ncbi:MAG: hypothetical protein CML31_15935 [Rhizobiales bacterium]|nr:hypothetical protein [Hyphomicrobiales bacterium]|tara:strand:- start:9732 stop:9971 length:240 start_codon:yes stop_codon:yes gene_type:complete
MAQRSKIETHSENSLALAGLVTVLWERLADSDADEPTMALISEIQRKARVALDQAVELEELQCCALSASMAPERPATIQ